MAQQRRSYNTKQRAAVLSCLTEQSRRFLSVDEVYDILRDGGASVGRTTVYRTLQTLVDEGVAAKVVTPGTGESRYRILETDGTDEGQLLCLDCGCALPLDCSMLKGFSEHVEFHHGFVIDRSRTVLYGYCSACAARREGER
ncbi:Fur family transcriptional regulator [Slackia exigua]